MKKLVLLFVAVFCVSATVAWSDELSSAQQAKLIQAIDSYAARMSDVALKIWSAPELGYQETKTSALLQDELKKAGFKVDAGVAGMPTAFVARAGTNDGPVIAILAEIDAERRVGARDRFGIAPGRRAGMERRGARLHGKTAADTAIEKSAGAQHC